MNLYAYLIITLACLSLTFAECPDKCSCDKRDIDSSIILEVQCNNLQLLPLELLTNDVTAFFLTSSNITVLPNIDEQVANITQITFLNLTRSHISKIEVNSLRVFPSLGYLILSESNLTNIPNELFETLPNLQNLSLRHNPNLFLPKNGFGIKELVRLDLSYCNVKDIPFTFFDSMPNIKVLFLSGNHLSHLGSHLITAFQTMDIVLLNHNNLTVLQPELVSLLHSKEEKFQKSNGLQTFMFLRGNPFPCDCRFKANIPQRYLFKSVDCFLPAEIDDKKDGDKDDVGVEDFLDSLNC